MNEWLAFAANIATILTLFGGIYAYFHFTQLADVSISISNVNRPNTFAVRCQLYSDTGDPVGLPREPANGKPCVWSQIKKGIYRVRVDKPLTDDPFALGNETWGEAYVEAPASVSFKRSLPYVAELSANATSDQLSARLLTQNPDEAAHDVVADCVWDLTGTPPWMFEAESAAVHIRSGETVELHCTQHFFPGLEGHKVHFGYGIRFPDSREYYDSWVDAASVVVPG